MRLRAPVELTDRLHGVTTADRASSCHRATKGEQLAADALGRASDVMTAYPLALLVHGLSDHRSSLRQAPRTGEAGPRAARPLTEFCRCQNAPSQSFGVGWVSGRLAAAPATWRCMQASLRRRCRFDST